MVPTLIPEDYTRIFGNGNAKEFWRKWHPRSSPDEMPYKKRKIATTTTSHQKAITLSALASPSFWCRLPPEVRLKIYSLVFGQRHVLIPAYTSSFPSHSGKTRPLILPPSLYTLSSRVLSPFTSTTPLTPATSLSILATSRQIYIEALPLLYSSTPIQVHSPPHFATHFLRLLTPFTLSQLKYLHLNLSPHRDSWDTTKQIDFLSVLHDYSELADSLNSIVVSVRMEVNGWMDAVKRIERVKRVKGEGMWRASGEDVRHFWTTFGGAVRMWERIGPFFGKGGREWKGWEARREVVWVVSREWERGKEGDGMVFVLHATRTRKEKV